VYAQGRLDEAEPIARRSLDIRVAALGETHEVTAQSHSALGWIYGSRGDLEKAATCHQAALDICQHVSETHARKRLVRVGYLVNEARRLRAVGEPHHHVAESALALAERAHRPAYEVQAARELVFAEA